MESESTSPTSELASTPKASDAPECGAPTNRPDHLAALCASAGFPARHLATPVKHDNAWGEAYRHALAQVGTGCILVLSGLRGTGKTRMALSLARYVLSKGPGLYAHTDGRATGVRYMRAMDLFLDLRAAFHKSDHTEKEVLQTINRKAFLVIDEVQERGGSDWEDRILTNVIDSRYGAMLDTVLITNTKYDEFVKSVGPSIHSRINETGTFIDCTWESFRKAGT